MGSGYSNAWKSVGFLGFHGCNGRVGPDVVLLRLMNICMLLVDTMGHLESRLCSSMILKVQLGNLYLLWQLRDLHLELFLYLFNNKK